MKAKKRKHIVVKNLKTGEVKESTKTFKEICDTYNLSYNYLKRGSATWMEAGREFKGLFIQRVYK